MGVEKLESDVWIKCGKNFTPCRPELVEAGSIFDVLFVAMHHSRREEEEI